jgi:putative tryptophan/tyrosine transport system substrate-binding protein
MRRRDLIILLGSAASSVAWPPAARAQQPPLPVIGVLSSAPAPPPLLAAFRQGLNESDYAEGRNVVIEFRHADGRYDRLPALAAELVARRVAVIFATTPPPVLAAKAATATIPIVFQMGGDPVEMGIVASLNRPGGNVTGISHLSDLLEPKRLEILHDLLPKVGTIAMLVNPTYANVERQRKDARAAARALGVGLHLSDGSTEGDLDAVFAELRRGRIEALLVAADAFFFNRRDRLVALAARYRLPAIFSLREFVLAGGLMSYGPSLQDSFRLAGVYSGRILKGEKPSDLPVHQAVKIELVLNQVTAKTLGIDFPLPLLGRADEVIE